MHGIYYQQYHETVSLSLASGAISFFDMHKNHNALKYFSFMFSASAKANGGIIELPTRAQT